MDSDKFISSTIKMFLVYGVWRSLVARTAGGREVAGSNPVTPIGVKSVSYTHLDVYKRQSVNRVRSGMEQP